MERHLTDLEHDRFGLKTIFHVIIGIAIFPVSHILASLPFAFIYSEEASLPLSLLMSIGAPILKVAILLLFIYFYVTKILKKTLPEFRICKPLNAAVWTICAIALPLCVSGFFILLIPGTFSVTGLSSEQIILRIVDGILTICLVAAITEEVIYRGFIMRLLEKRWNKYIAIIIPSLFFGFMHIFNMDNPNIVDILMLMIAGTSVGIMFSLIVFQSGSVWPSAIVHGIWNLIIDSGILRIGNESEEAIFTYTIHSNSTLITGGAFGIDASIPALIGYIGVIILAIVLHRKNLRH